MKPATPRFNARDTHRSRSTKIIGSAGRNNSKSESSKKDLIYYNYNKPEYRSNKYKYPKKSDKRDISASFTQNKKSIFFN
jgi:hypothetical protein